MSAPPKQHSTPLAAASQWNPALALSPIVISEAGFLQMPHNNKYGRGYRPRNRREFDLPRRQKGMKDAPPQSSIPAKPPLARSVRTLENTRACEKMGTAYLSQGAFFYDAWTERAVPNFSPRPLSPGVSFPSLPDRRAEEDCACCVRHSWRAEFADPAQHCIVARSSPPRTDPRPSGRGQHANRLPRLPPLAHPPLHLHRRHPPVRSHRLDRPGQRDAHHRLQPRRRGPRQLSRLRFPLAIPRRNARLRQPVVSRMSDVRAAFSTGDAATIRDTAKELWDKISREDAIFLVTDPRGKVIASLGGVNR